MLLRATIAQVIDSTHVRVRIPEYNKGPDSVGNTPLGELPIAIISTVPGCKTHYRKGDCVIVGFERDDIGSPVVLGALASAVDNAAFTEANFSSINVSLDAKLPADTSVLGAGKDFWPYLRDLKVDLQNKLNLIDEAIKQLQQTDLSLMYPFAEKQEF